MAKIPKNYIGYLNNEVEEGRMSHGRRDKIVKKFLRNKAIEDRRAQVMSDDFMNRIELGYSFC